MARLLCSRLPPNTLLVSTRLGISYSWIHPLIAVWANRPCISLRPMLAFTKAALFILKAGDPRPNRPGGAREVHREKRPGMSYIASKPRLAVK